MGCVPLELAWGESLVLALQSLKLVMQVKDQQEEMEDRMESEGVEIGQEFEKQVDVMGW